MTNVPSDIGSRFSSWPSPEASVRAVHGRQEAAAEAEGEAEGAAEGAAPGEPAAPLASSAPAAP
jgi:hypothetical protein